MMMDADMRVHILVTPPDYLNLAIPFQQDSKYRKQKVKHMRIRLSMYGQ